MARRLNGKEFEFINNSEYLDRLKEKHFTVIDRKDLKKSAKSGKDPFDKYLWETFKRAYLYSGYDPRQDESLVLDNPLDNLSYYFDGSRLNFWSRIYGTSCLNPKSKVYVSWDQEAKKNSFFQYITGEKIPEKSQPQLEKIRDEIGLSHGSDINTLAVNSCLDSHFNLDRAGKLNGGRTKEQDKRLNNDGFIFTTICPKSDPYKSGNYLQSSKTVILLKKEEIEKLPILVISVDQLYTDINNDGESQQNVYICEGSQIGEVMAGRYRFYAKEMFEKKIFKNAEIGFCSFLENFKNGLYGCECRIPTYVYLTNNMFME